MTRPPTSHEQHAGRSWDASYTGGGPAPWDIGRPQTAFARMGKAYLAFARSEASYYSAMF